MQFNKTPLPDYLASLDIGMKHLDRSFIKHMHTRLPSWTGGVATRRRAKRTDIVDGVVDFIKNDI